MKRKWINDITGESGIDDITIQMIERTQAIAERIGFPFVPMIGAVTNYINPDTDQKYTDEEARKVLETFGVDVDADIANEKRRYEEYEEYCKTLPPPKKCMNCGHEEMWHHYHGTNKCQCKDCVCESDNFQ